MSHSNLSTTHEPEHAFVDSMREIGYYDGSIRGCNNYPLISSICRFLSADPLWAIIILSHLIGRRKESSILSVEWAETGSQLNGFCRSHQSWLVIELVMTSHDHDRSSKTRWSWPHNTDPHPSACLWVLKYYLKHSISSGRPNGQKNKVSHSTGGARTGSGRKRHDITLKFYIGPWVIVTPDANPDKFEKFFETARSNFQTDVCHSVLVKCQFG